MDRPGEPVSGTVLDVAAWTRAALAELRALPDVCRVGLALAEGGGRRLRFTASDRDNDAAPDWCHVDAYDDVPLTTVVRTAEPVVATLEALDGRFGDFADRQRGTPYVAVAAVPIESAGQTLGGFVLYFDRSQAFDADQRATLQRVGRRLGTALRLAQRREQRHADGTWDQPVPREALVAVHRVARGVEGVATARHFLQQVLESWQVEEETVFAAVLCLSELVTNAVVHAHADCVVRVLLERGGVLTTTVRDGGRPPDGAGEPGDDPLRVHGRGLQIVDALAERWGSALDDVGTTVWFVLHTGADPLSPRAGP